MKAKTDKLLQEVLELQEKFYKAKGQESKAYNVYDFEKSMRQQAEYDYQMKRNELILELGIGSI